MLGGVDLKSSILSTSDSIQVVMWGSRGSAVKSASLPPFSACCASLCACACVCEGAPAFLSQHSFGTKPTSESALSVTHRQHGEATFTFRCRAAPRCRVDVKSWKQLLWWWGSVTGVQAERRGHWSSQYRPGRHAGAKWNLEEWQQPKTDMQSWQKTRRREKGGEWSRAECVKVERLLALNQYNFFFIKDAELNLKAFLLRSCELQPHHGKWHNCKCPFVPKS